MVVFPQTLSLMGLISMCLINMTVMSVWASWNLLCVATTEECHMPEGHNKLCLPQKQTLQTLTMDLYVFNNRKKQVKSPWKKPSQRISGQDSLVVCYSSALWVRAHMEMNRWMKIWVFSLQFSGSTETVDAAELFVLIGIVSGDVCQISRAVDLGSPALEFASAFD